MVKTKASKILKRHKLENMNILPMQLKFYKKKLKLLCKKKCTSYSHNCKKNELADNFLVSRNPCFSFALVYTLICFFFHIPHPISSSNFAKSMEKNAIYIPLNQVSVFVSNLQLTCECIHQNVIFVKFFSSYCRHAVSIEIEQ